MTLMSIQAGTVITVRDYKNLVAASRHCPPVFVKKYVVRKQLTAAQQRSLHRDVRERLKMEGR